MWWTHSLEPHLTWLSIGVLLCIAEMILPGVFLLWLGIAALATGLIALILPIGLPVQLALFAALSIASVFFGRRWSGTREIPSEDPLLNDRTARLIGEQVTLASAIVGGEGRATVGDSVWIARGPDLPAGARVRIIGAKGTVLEVEPA
jgi:hypothetical protein